LGHVFQGVGAKAEVFPASLAVLSDQPRLSENLEVIGHAGLGCAQDLLELGHTPFPLRQEFQDG
jgi:hypothetical protein